MPLTPSNNPVFSESIPELDGNSVAHFGTWNPIHQALLDNTAAVKRDSEKAAVELGVEVDRLDSRVAGIESSSAVSVQNAVDLAWIYGGNVLKFEMFAAGYTLIDLQPLAVIQGVNGDDSVDVATTAGLRAGEFYVLTDAAAAVSVLVQIQTVLSATRIRLAANLSRDWGDAARLVRCSFDVRGARQALAKPGDIYLSRSISVGTDQAGGAVVIRRTLNGGLARLFYRDGYQQAWRECGWSMRRTGGEVPAGFADYEYILPMRGDGWLRVDVTGEPMTITHLVALGSPTGLGGYTNPDLRPNTPVLSGPAAAATNITERPTLAVAAYRSPSGNAQNAIQFQLSNTAAFANVLHDSGVLPSGLSYAVPAGLLVAGTAYYWRVRVQDVAGLWSDWMTVATFTTAASVAYVMAPTVTGPAANATDVPEQPTISLSAFVAIGGADTHKSSQIRIRTAEGTYAAPVWDSGADAVNKLSMVVPANKLKSGALGYFVQARQEGTNRGWSEWGPESKLTTKLQFANVIGLAMVAPGGGSGTWARIDENGESKVTDAAFFSSHAVYGAIQSVVIDGQDMVKIPAFYVKAGYISGGTYNNKRAWWISDQPLPGYVLHPAFMNAGQPLAQFWMSKHQASYVNNKLCSVSGQPVKTAQSLVTFREWANARNENGVSGFQIWNYYQLQAIQLLCAIEIGGTDVQALIAPGVNIQSAVNTGTPALGEWRGMQGLWGNYQQMIEGLRTTSAQVQIWDNKGNKSWVGTIVLATERQGFQVAVSDDSGPNYDLSIGFFPTTLDTAANSSFGRDSVFISPSKVAYVGGGYNHGQSVGLFHLRFEWTETHYGDWGTRMAKI